MRVIEAPNPAQKPASYQEELAKLDSRRELDADETFADETFADEAFADEADQRDRREHHQHVVKVVLDRITASLDYLITLEPGDDEARLIALAWLGYVGVKRGV